MRKLFVGERWNGGFWLRLWENGPGVAVKDTRKHRKYFSERNGYCRGIDIGPWFVRLLDAYIPPQHPITIGRSIIRTSRALRRSRIETAPIERRRA